MCTPRIGPPFSATTFTIPSDSPMISARPLPMKRWVETCDVVALLLGLGLGEAAEGDLGVAVDAPRHLAVVDGTTGSPRMALMAMMASAKPTWASCGVATRSPTA